MAFNGDCYDVEKY